MQILGALIYDEPAAPTGELTMPELEGLPHPVYALSTMGGGRCSIAAPMLAMGRLLEEDLLVEDVDQSAFHNLVDAERLLLGHSMSVMWSEERWVREVPVDLRMSQVHEGHVAVQTSFDILHQKLTDIQLNTAWMEPTIFYVAAEMYEVGIFVVTWYPERGNSAAHYRHVRPTSKEHIVVWFARGHFQAVQYNGQRMFASRHPLVERLRLLCVSLAPPVAPEDDVDLQIIAARLSLSQVPLVVDHRQPAEASAAEIAADPPPLRRNTRSMSATTKPLARSTVSRPKSTPTALAACEHSAVDTPSEAAAGATRQHRSNRSKSAKAEAAGISAVCHEPLPPGKKEGKQALKSQAEPVRSAVSHAQLTGAHPSPADVAAHGQLYDYISFPNVPQWVSMCCIPFNAYRLASQSNNRTAQDQAVEDILMLPQRVLTRTGRGPGDHQRLNRVMRARCRSQGELLRQKYECQPARDHNVQLNETARTAPLVRHVADFGDTHESRAVLFAKDTAVVSPCPTDGTVEVVEGSACENDFDGDAVRAFMSVRRAGANDCEPDIKAARKAQHHVRQGHLQKAARVLHSIDALADLRLPEVGAEGSLSD